MPSLTLGGSVWSSFHWRRIRAHERALMKDHLISLAAYYFRVHIAHRQGHEVAASMDRGADGDVEAESLTRPRVRVDARLSRRLALRSCANDAPNVGCAPVSRLDLRRAFGPRLRQLGGAQAARLE